MRRIRKLVVGLVLLLFATRSYATDWELGIRVLSSDGQRSISAQVCLYHPNHLTVPIRYAYSIESSTPSINIKGDIDDPGKGEPTMSFPGTASWRVIKPGDYILRIGNVYAPITIELFNYPTNERDFTLEYRYGGSITPFSPAIGNRCEVGSTLTWTATTACQTTLDQKLSDESTTVGQIFHVFSDGYQIEGNLTAETIPIVSPSTVAFRADRSLYNAEKYHDWNAAADVSNHRSFDINGSTASLVAHFQPPDNSITVTTDLLEVPGSTAAGNVEFADPWFVDYADPSYGNLYRNQGTNPNFHERGASFNPNSSTSYEHDYKYNGVFLNQSNSLTWPMPYYSVGAVNSVTFTSGLAYFSHWGGTDVDLKTPTVAQTGVIFKAANAQAKAWYKAHLGSSIANATAYNSQRKVVRSGTNYHMVYESVNDIYYTYSTNSGSTWSAEQPVSLGYFGSRRCNPSLFVDPQRNDLYLVYEVVDGSYRDITIRWKPNGQA